MRFNFKKIAALGASLVLTGMSMGMAAAASYPAPFVQNGSANVAIVYGSGATMDLAAAQSIQDSLNSSYSATASGSVSVSGESQNMASSARKLYYGDSINAAYSSLSATELPTVLADGTFTDLAGTQYTYTQTITPGTTASVFGTSSGDLPDPELYLNVGTDTAAPLYNYTLSLNKNLNVSDATNVQGQTMRIMGVDYVIGAGSTNSTLYLYGAGQTVTANQGESQSINIGGSPHTVELVAATGTNTATISVDGVQRSVTQGSSYSFAGDLNIYVKTVTYQAYAGGIQNVELIVGANTLKIVDGSSIKMGADLTSIKGTMAHITASGAGEISGLTISVAAAKSQNDSLSVGQSFTDPVFGGLKVVFADAMPGLNDSSRGKVVVDAGSLNTQQSQVTFTSYRDSSEGEQTLTYAYDNDTTAMNVALAHQSFSNGKGYIHVLEGENAAVNDWIVLNQGDAGTIVEVSDISIDNAQTGTVTLTDVISGQSFDVTLTNSSDVYSKTGVNMFGGTGYTIKADGAGTHVNITWSGANTLTVFPRIKLADGGWIAFLQNTTVPNADAVIFPNGKTTLDTTGTAVNATLAPYVYANGLNWTLADAGSDTSKITGVNVSGSEVSFGVGPAILFAEPKKWNDASQGDYIVVPMTSANSGKDMSVTQPVMSGTNSGFLSLTSDSYEQQAVDQYGTFLVSESRTNQNGRETISYPASQMYLDVLFAAASAVSGSGADLGNVIVTDNQVSSVATKNLIVVGGSCVNTVAATLLGSSQPMCTDAWQTATGVGDGEFLIQSFGSSSVTSGLAVLVAGYNAADTAKAATYLTSTPNLDLSAGKKYKGTTATSTVTTVSS